MRICLPIGYLPLGTVGGVETYARNLVKTIQTVDRSNEYLLYCSISNEKAFPVIAKNFKKIISGKYKPIEIAKLKAMAIVGGIIFESDSKSLFMKIVRRSAELAVRAAKFFHNPSAAVTSQQCDVMHYMFNAFPHEKHYDAPVVLTIVDIQQEYFPQFFNKESLELRRLTYRASAEKADHIIVISEFTKRSLIEKYAISGDKISVVYLGHCENFKKIDTGAVSAFRKRHVLPENFIFYPAATWPHKNHINLVRAYKILKEKYAIKDKLILTGIKKQNHTNVEMEIERLGLSEYITHLGYMPYEDLPLLYNAAGILVFPSLFEGFGIPVVEAMATGLPVACSNTTSLPEVAGDAAVVFNPEDPYDIAEKVSMLYDKDLRNTLIGKGFERARSFTWERTAEETLKVYEKVYKEFTGKNTKEKA
ncbi:MAG: glycosyltransferase family 1 protein [Deltaproteobacteria bacterium]|nr:glycosyltransferase family 1 protein [Deltaproteobacteria bacterium]